VEIFRRKFKDKTSDTQRGRHVNLVLARSGVSRCDGAPGVTLDCVCSYDSRAGGLVLGCTVTARDQLTLLQRNCRWEDKRRNGRWHYVL